jgi:F-type H+-transporting ATPase subunit delta
MLPDGRCGDLAAYLYEDARERSAKSRWLSCARKKGLDLAEENDAVSGVAGRYASALYSLASEQRQAGEVAAALKTVSDLIAESPDLQRLVRSPVFSAEQQAKAFDAILEQAGVSGIAANFVRLVASKRRLFVLPDMIKGYNQLYDAARGLTRAEVTSAAPLTDEQITELKEQLRGKAAGQDVDISIKVDPALIGGIIVKLGSRMVDGSLRTKLNAIRTAMKEVR